MKKNTIIASSIILASFLVGCGSSSNSSSTPSDANISKEVTIERGAILNAVVSDAKGNTAIAVDSYSNIYKFSEEISFPVTVSSGIIDVNANGQIDDSDIELKTTLKSSDNKVSLISTLIYDEDKTKQEEKLKKLYDLTKKELNQEEFKKEDLLKLPSENKVSAILTNAIYKDFKSKDIKTADYMNELSSDNAQSINDLETNLSNLKTMFDSDDSENLKEKAKKLESAIVNDLVTGNKLETLDTTKVEELKKQIESKNIYFDENTINGKTYYFKNKNGDLYLKFTFSKKDAKLEIFKKLKEVWTKDSFSSTIPFSIKNSKLVFNEDSQMQTYYLNQAFNNEFIYNKNLVESMPVELEGVDKVEEPTTIKNLDISNLKNKVFYTSIDDDKDYFCMVSMNNSFSGEERCYIKINNKWEVESTDKLEYGEFKTTKTELIYETNEHITKTTIEKVTEEYYLMNFYNKNKLHNVVHEGKDKWYLKRPLWITL